MVEYEIKQTLGALKKTLDDTAQALDIKTKQARIKELSALMADESVFLDMAKYAVLGKEARAIENVLEGYFELEKRLNDCEALLELSGEDGGEELFDELIAEIKTAQRLIGELSVAALMRGEYDNRNAILTIHAGAGGTEAQDWVQMLYRMYKMFCDKNGYSVRELDFIAGDEAGIKSVTFAVGGDNAYGYLKAERGVHRLVRISPFDSNARRHTSFASVEAMPEIEEDNVIEIKTDELKIDTYRSGGAGGQHVNKTESAIRITHLPTGIIVQCQNERSQIQNRQTAMEMLRGKLVELREREQAEKAGGIKGELKKIEWGSQIRSYVFAPYTLVKDHRTNYETGDVHSVMDGAIKEFIIDYLKKSY